MRSPLRRLRKESRSCSLSLLRLSKYRIDDKHTRSQKGSASYLDYFLFSGVQVSRLSVGQPIGKSDHRAVSCSVSQVQPVRRKRRTIFSKKLASEELENVLESTGRRN